jgi:hypothetical protein
LACVVLHRDGFAEHRHPATAEESADMSWAEDRPVAGSGWNTWRGVVGGFYLAAAVFNALYTVPKTGEPDLLDGYADGAWFPVLEDFMRDVFMPNDQLLLVLVIVFEVAVGLAILNRGIWVDVGVAASLLWVIAILPFLAWPYLITNVVLVVLQGVLLLRRYDNSIWSLIPRSRMDRSRGPAA